MEACRSNLGLEEPEESFIFPKTQLIEPEIIIPFPYNLRIELLEKIKISLTEIQCLNYQLMTAHFWETDVKNDRSSGNKNR